MFAAIAQNIYLVEYNKFIEDTAYKYDYICEKTNTYPTLIKTEQKTILECIDNLKNMDMNIDLKKKINKYSKSMKQLLKLYDNGKGLENFKKDNLELYSILTTNFTKFTDLKDDIENNTISLSNTNKYILLNIMNVIIKEHDDIINNVTKYIFSNLNRNI